MKLNKILYTGFKKIDAKDISCSFLLLERLHTKRCFFFTNDFASIDNEVEKILEEDWNVIVMFGQKPIVKNLRIEKCAYSGDEILYSNFDLSKLERVLQEKNIDYKLSTNPGTSYCNHAYYRMLANIKSMNLNTKVVFIHIPYVDNFRQMDEVVNLLNE